MGNASKKCECGYTYVPGHPDDEENHRIIHDEYLSGPEIEAVSVLSPIGEVNSYPFYVVDCKTPKEIRQQIAKVAYVAQLSMQEYPAGYDGTATEEDDQRLYFIGNGLNIISMAITATEDRFWSLSWKKDGTIKLLSRDALFRDGFKVARVWTAGNYRRSGLALQMLHKISRTLHYKTADLGWEMPFTEGGASLVKRICPEDFLGCGDPFFFRDSISEFP